MAKKKKPKTANFNWASFAKRAIKLLDFASRSTIAPVDAGRWEEIVFHALKDMGEKYNGGLPEWRVGSHAPGADIRTDSFGLSIKSGAIKDEKIVISSYRLTRFSNLKEMTAFIDGGGKNFDLYLCCARMDKKDGSRAYTIFAIPADVFTATKLTWTESFGKRSGVTSGWHGVSKNGVVVDIVKNMSSQLWMQIPLKLCLKIGEVGISKDQLGSALSKVLRS